MRIFGLLLLVFIGCNREKSEIQTTEISSETILHTSGLIDDENISIVVANCTGCHSGQLVAQNRATREGWKEMIVWMQKSQNLGDLGVNEEIILDYLEKYYGPKDSGRRRALVVDEWYKLN